MVSKKNHPDWEEATKGVRPLPKKDKVNKPLPKTPGRRVVRGVPESSHNYHPTEARPQNPFDPRLFDKIARGKVRIQFSFDLHGMTEGQAFEALLDELGKAFDQGRRYGLIITGKGRDGKSPIRAGLPKWLSSPKLSQVVSSFAYSAPRHGGEGAFYVLLRRRGK